MSENVTVLIKENAALVGENLRQFFRILATPGEFISSIRRRTNELLVPASIFAALMSLLNLALHLPVLRFLRIESESASYFVVDTILTYAFWFIYGSGFHLAARILRGHGDYATSLVSFLYLTAFFPVLVAVTIPIEPIVRRCTVDGTDTTSLEFQLCVVPSFLSSTPALISFVMGSIVFVWYLIALTKVFSIVHNVGKLRSAFIVLLGLSFWMLLTLPVELSAFQIFWKAYRNLGV